jgi:hypothetical protein
MARTPVVAKHAPAMAWPTRVMSSRRSVKSSADEGNPYFQTSAHIMSAPRTLARTLAVRAP